MLDAAEIASGRHGRSEVIGEGSGQIGYATECVDEGSEETVMAAPERYRLSEEIRRLREA